MEDLFDQDDVAMKPTLAPTDKDVEDVNNGTTDKQKIVKLSKTLSAEVKEKPFIYCLNFLMFSLGIMQT